MRLGNKIPNIGNGRFGHFGCNVWETDEFYHDVNILTLNFISEKHKDHFILITDEVPRINIEWWISLKIVISKGNNWTISNHEIAGFNGHFADTAFNFRTMGILNSTIFIKLVLELRIIMIPPHHYRKKKLFWRDLLSGCWYSFLKAWVFRSYRIGRLVWQCKNKRVIRMSTETKNEAITRGGGEFL